MRANPRSAILQTLQEGPRDIIQLWWSLGAAQVGRGGVRDISALEQRALCKLIRSRKVVRLAGGKYARRGSPVYWDSLRHLRGLAQRVSDT